MENEEAAGKPNGGGETARGGGGGGGRYVQYNVLGNLFQVPSKCVPPTQPVDRGAYGIVCCATNAETKEEVAIKKIGNAFDTKRPLRKIKLLCHMDHNDVIAGINWSIFCTS